MVPVGGGRPDPSTFGPDPSGSGAIVPVTRRCASYRVVSLNAEGDDCATASDGHAPSTTSAIPPSRRTPLMSKRSAPHAAGAARCGCLAGRNRDRSEASHHQRCRTDDRHDPTVRTTRERRSWTRGYGQLDGPSTPTTGSPAGGAQRRLSTRLCGGGFDSVLGRVNPDCVG